MEDKELYRQEMVLKLPMIKVYFILKSIYKVNSDDDSNVHTKNMMCNCVSLLFLLCILNFSGLLVSLITY